MKSNGTLHSPIAIIGLGFRFPGSVGDPRSFWRLLRDGVDAITDIPPDRIDTTAYYDPRPAVPGKMSTRWGGFIDNVDGLDAAFFGISPREALRMDPQQRLLLEVAWEALEDAGQPSDRVSGSLTGVFMGLWTNDYESRLFADPAAVDFYMTTGTGRYAASGRLSYVLGLEGPSLTVDTACSSGLVAVHLACQSLRLKECSMALAGGANLILQPQISIAYSQSKMIAPDGRCKFGDSRANGYVRSEGAGVIVLKRLSAALEDGDPIYAIIRGSAVNSDGRLGAFMATPAREGQEKMLRQAYRDAGISPGLVDYIEAHGTGTVAGDPVELGALGNVLSLDRPAGKPCYVGSVKTNIGHTEAAAGIAGLIKASLVLKHRAVPAGLHLLEPNPAIDWGSYPFVIPTKLTELPQDGSLTAGVSAFGISGTNAHIVLTEAPHQVQADGSANSSLDSTRILPLSAGSPQALASLARDYVSLLEEKESHSFYDICYSAAVRRTHHEHRVAIAGSGRETTIDSLRALLRGESVPGLSTGKADAGLKSKVVFVCSGQGSQWVGMGRQLLREEPVFHKWIQLCDSALSRYVDWSLENQLALDPDASSYRLNEIDVIQPALFSIQVGLGELWRSWGVKPDVVVGHSMGEVAAAYLAGALSLDDAAHVICVRSKLLRRISGKGAMALVALPANEARECLAGFEDRVSVAVSNSSRSTVLAGDPAAIQAIVEQLQARDVFCRLVKVDVAAHSPQVDALTSDLLRELSGLQPLEAQVRMHSTVTAEGVNGAQLNAGYWSQNLRCPVLFSKTVQTIAAEGAAVFVELSPHPLLTAAIEESASGGAGQFLSVPSLERDQDEGQSLRSSIGRLYTFGYPVDWARLFPRRGTVVHLPSYPWQRERFWLQPEPPISRQSQSSLLPEHPVLGHRLPDVASLPDTVLWQKELGAGSLQLSQSACVEMAAAAAAEVFGPNLHGISNFITEHPPDQAPYPNAETQLILDIHKQNSALFHLYCRGGGSDARWKQFASGQIRRSHAPADWIYELAWKEKALWSSRVEPSTGSWVIFKDRRGIGDAIAAEMRAHGQECMIVSAGESFETQDPRCVCISPGEPDHFRKLFKLLEKEGRPNCRGIVYLWGLDSLDGGCDEALRLVQSIARTEWGTAPRLWLVTSGAQAVEQADGDSLSLDQTLLWGMGKVIALEHPELWGGLIDLPHIENPALADSAVAELCQELLAGDDDDQVALRKDRRYVLRLSRSSPVVVREPLAISPDGTYLITGGLGNLGLHLARWLVDHGARHLVLTGRVGLPQRSTWPQIPNGAEVGKQVAAVQSLEERGATIHIARADVADRGQMSDLWEELDAHHPPVRGIIHAAGILRARELVHLESDEFHDVLRSKVAGASLLHEHVQATDRRAGALDFFVLFSSGASVWGSQNQAHYAAANQFLDSLAQHRAARGLPALSVNWGWWQGAGLVSDELAALMASIGLRSLPVESALAALEYLLESGAVQKTVADVDWSVFCPVFEAKRKRPLLEGLATPVKEADAGAPPEKKRLALLEKVEYAATSQRAPILRDYIRHQVAEILGFHSSDHIDLRQGFFRMGMDSVMTVQLRNRLESALGLPLPPTVAFEYPTTEGLAAYLAGLILVPEESGVALLDTPEEEQTNDEDAGFHELSEEDLVAQLARKLEQIR
jgi:acyl transferase domain-containing protein/acyl carrier protein